MKRLLILSFCIITCTAHAQFGFSIKAGTNYGGPIGNVDGEGAVKPGITGGVEGVYRFTPKSAIALNVLYSYYNLRYSQVSQGDSTVYVTVGQQQVPVNTTYTSNVKGHLQLHYLHLPVWYCYSIGKHGRLDVGPYVSFLVAGSDKGTNDIVFVENGVFNQKAGFNNFAEINKTDVGISLGGSYTTGFGLSVSIFAMRGFVPLYRNGFFSSRGVKEVKLYNTFVHLTLGYNIGKR